MKKKDPKDKKELVRSTLFDEVTWIEATNGFITSCRRIKPEGWATIQKEAMAFAKVINRCPTFIDDVGTSTQADTNDRANLAEDSNTEKEVEVVEEVKVKVKKVEVEVVEVKKVEVEVIEVEDEVEMVEPDLQGYDSSSSGSSSSQSSMWIKSDPPNYGPRPWDETPTDDLSSSESTEDGTESSGELDD